MCARVHARGSVCAVCMVRDWRRSPVNRAVLQPMPVSTRSCRASALSCCLGSTVCCAKFNVAAVACGTTAHLPQFESSSTGTGPSERWSQSSECGVCLKSLDSACSRLRLLCLRATLQMNGGCLQPSQCAALLRRHISYLVDVQYEEVGGTGCACVDAVRRTHVAWLRHTAVVSVLTRALCCASQALIDIMFTFDNEQGACLHSHSAMALFCCRCCEQSSCSATACRRHGTPLRAVCMGAERPRLLDCSGSAGAVPVVSRRAFPARFAPKHFFDRAQFYGARAHVCVCVLGWMQNPERCNRNRNIVAQGCLESPIRYNRQDVLDEQ